MVGQQEKHSLRLSSRLAIISSIAYYGLDEPLVTDAQFDEWCRKIYDEWDDLDPVTQWKLGDPHSIHTSGFHIKCSDMDIHGLVVWLKHHQKFRYRLMVPTKSWKTPEQFRFRYCNVGDVSWDKRHPVS